MDKETYKAAKDDAERKALVRLADAVEKQNQALNIIVALLAAATFTGIAVLWKLNAMQFATNLMH